MWQPQAYLGLCAHHCKEKDEVLWLAQAESCANNPLGSGWEWDLLWIEGREKVVLERQDVSSDKPPLGKGAIRVIYMYIGHRSQINLKIRKIKCMLNTLCFIAHILDSEISFIFWVSTEIVWAVKQIGRWNYQPILPMTNLSLTSVSLRHKSPTQPLHENLPNIDHCLWFYKSFYLVIHGAVVHTLLYKWQNQGFNLLLVAYLISNRTWLELGLSLSLSKILSTYFSKLRQARIVTVFQFIGNKGIGYSLLGNSISICIDIYFLNEW